MTVIDTGHFIASVTLGHVIKGELKDEFTVYAFRTDKAGLLAVHVQLRWKKVLREC